jgi:hypothetical protein
VQETFVGGLGQAIIVDDPHGAEIGIDGAGRGIVGADSDGGAGGGQDILVGVEGDGAAVVLRIEAASVDGRDGAAVGDGGIAEVRDRRQTVGNTAATRGNTLDVGVRPLGVGAVDTDGGDRGGTVNDEIAARFVA